MASKILVEATVSGHKNIPSSFYYDAFSQLGYTKSLTQKRVQISDNLSACLTRVCDRNYNEGLQVLIPGSRGEGMAVANGSDIDVLYVQPLVKCFETNQHSRANETDVATFQMVLADTLGYTRLRLISIMKQHDLKDKKNYSLLLERLNGALIEKEGCQYLRNDHRLLAPIEIDDMTIERTGWVTELFRILERSGPSQPHQRGIPSGEQLNVDSVPAFPLFYPSALDEWNKRERSNQWPSREAIDEVMKAEVLVVPTGEPGINDILNWRISFTVAERLLVRSFNDIQIKVFAALKTLAKQHLKPKCSAITSYVVKNILFWVFEARQGTFGKDDFIEVLSQALTYMKDCISRCNLENYMTPSRNMLNNRIKGPAEKADVLKCLDLMLQEGPSVLLLCPLIKKMTDLSDSALKERLKVRELVDQVGLSYCSLPPEEYDVTEHAICQAKSVGEFIGLSLVRVLPTIRRSNPFEYFNLLISMQIIDVIPLFVKGLKEDGGMWID